MRGDDKKKRRGEGGGKRRKGESSLTTIRGIVIPTTWDDMGHVTATVISTWNEDEYLVDSGDKGKDLLSHIREEVEVSGITRDIENKKIITVKRLSLKKRSGSTG